MDFEILYRLYFRDVYRYVRGLSRDEHLAEEIAQETFARALGAVDRFDGRGDVRAWLFTIARNVWVDHCRRHRRETELPGSNLDSIHHGHYFVKVLAKPFLLIVWRKRNENGVHVILRHLRLSRPCHIFFQADCVDIEA